MHTPSKTWIAAGCLAAAITATTANAQVTLNASDGFGASSFNTAGGWSNNEVPSAGNAYVVDNGLRLRTPASGDSFTFAGDSLTMAPNGLSGYNLPGGELMYKGTGTTGVITINNLIMNGGNISHANGTGDHFNLAGNLNMAADSVIYAKQGRINITANITGSATLTIPETDALDANRSVYISSPTNTFTGNLIVGAGARENTARLDLVNGANLNFVIGTNGINNSVSGGGMAVFDGIFLFDLSGASSDVGDSWAIASVTSQSFGSNFSVSGFDDLGSGLWGSGNFVFSETTGALEVIPEPSTYALIFGGFILAGALIRRRLNRA